MGDSVWIWPSADMDFWKINNEETSVIIKWSRNCFEDYNRRVKINGIHRNPALLLLLPVL